MYLQDVSHGRNNNFTLLRLILATLVIFTHSQGITGFGDAQILKLWTGKSFGSLAVDMFFVVSGFLIVKSWLRREKIIDFTLARLLRIYPGLFVCVVLTVFILGPVFTVLPLTEYFTHIDTLKFLLENITLVIIGVFPNLPGVFEAQGGGGVNASLWTLPFELKMYFILLVAALVASWLKPLARPFLLLIIVAISYCYYALAPLVIEQALPYGVYARFIFFFFSGSLIYLYRNLIPLSHGLTIFCLGLLVVTILFLDRFLAQAIMALITPYVTLYLALTPSQFGRHFNRYGDYSYGLYIYGFPVQQAVLAIAGEQHYIQNFLYSWSFTLILAVASWHWVEARALSYIRPLSEYFTRSSQRLAYREL